MKTLGLNPLNESEFELNLINLKSNESQIKTEGHSSLNESEIK